MLPPVNGAFEVHKASGSSSEETVLSGSAYQYSSYAQFPVGRYQLSVFKKGGKAPVKVFDVDLKPNTFFTILVSPKGGFQSTEMTEDTLDPKATSGTLIIRNYFQGSTIVASTKEAKIVDALAYGQSAGPLILPAKRVPIHLSVRLSSGELIESGIEPDLRGASKATVLIIPDSYGRFAPIVTFDGKNL